MGSRVFVRDRAVEGVEGVTGDGMGDEEALEEGVVGGVKYGEGTKRRRHNVCMMGYRGKIP